MRLLFDELASSKVAKALAALGYRVFHVGGDGQPPRGTPDEDVLRHAQKCSQVVVTQNNDMVVLCAEQGEPVIWLSPRDGDISLLSLTKMCLEQITKWEPLLAEAPSPICIIAYKTTIKALPLEDAKRIAIDRGKRRRRQIQKKAKAAPLGGLLEDES